MKIYPHAIRAHPHLRRPAWQARNPRVQVVGRERKGASTTQHAAPISKPSDIRMSDDL